jgi:hypothetical protein
MGFPDAAGFRPAKACTGCGQPTVVSLWDGEENVPLCPECLLILRERPEARELLLARRSGEEGPAARPS